MKYIPQAMGNVQYKTGLIIDEYQKPFRIISMDYYLTSVSYGKFGSPLLEYVLIEIFSIKTSFDNGFMIVIIIGKQLGMWVTSQF
jgi:hypothetical protein